MSKILIIGHGRHGKDEFAQLLCKYLGVTYQSSSAAVAKEIFPVVDCALGYNYTYIENEVLGADKYEEAFEDRHNHRELWKRCISLYNSYDKAALVKKVLETNDIYVGLRCNQEYQECRRQGIFDYVLLVDASKRVDYVDPTYDIPYDVGMFTIPNNQGLEKLEEFARGWADCIRRNEVKQC